MDDLNRKKILSFITDRKVDNEDYLLEYLVNSYEIPSNLSYLKNQDYIKDNLLINDVINNFYDTFFDKKIYSLKELKDEDSILNKILNNLAKLTDLLDENGYNLYYIDPKKIFYTGNGDLIFNWDSFNEFITNDELRISKKVLNDYKKFINPKIIKKGVIKIDDLNNNLSQYTFLSIIYMITTDKEQRKHFRDAKGLLNAIFHIEKNSVIYDFLRLNLKEIIPFETTISLLDFFKKKLKNNPYNKISKTNLSINIGHDTIHGIRKKGIINQDSFFYIKISNDKLLFMVADGVSTADIGSGDIISKKIQEYLFENQEKIKKDIDYICTNESDPENNLGKYLNEIIIKINLSLESLVNYYINQTGFSSDKAIMSSTLVMGFIYGNNMLTSHLGDSELIFIRDNEVKQLLTPHTLAVKELKGIFNSIDDGKFQGFVDLEDVINKKEITNALPLGYIDEKNKFIAEKDLFIENNMFYLKEGDIVIATTDGLSDSINNSNKDVDKYLLDFFATEKNMNRKLIRRLVNSIDENGGIDDITVIALSFRIKQ